MSQQITQQNFQVIIRVRPLNCKQQQQIQSYEYAQSKKFKTSSNNKAIKLSPQAYAFYTKFYNVTNLSDIMKVQNNEAIYVIDTEYKNAQRKMKPFFFSHVYNQKQTSEQIFQQSIEKQIQCIFDGFNYTILAYGITGSGKTHTVFGSHQKHEKGISGIALNYLFNKQKQLQKDGKVKVNLGFSFVQIYNQNVRDLLNSQGKMLNIIEDSKGNTSFTDAIQIQIRNQDQIHDLINIGLAKRSSGATMANQYSSRSHAVIQMNVEIISQNQRVTSKMFIIDLAGSEKIQTLNTAKKMLEGANINKSLLALGNCINILAEHSKKSINSSNVHIPYRDSKLTRILKDSLGGNAKSLMIACVSSNPFTIQETITTLNYAQRAQGIKKQIRKNKLFDEQESKRLCANCCKQMSSRQNGIQVYGRIKLPISMAQPNSNDPKQQSLTQFFQGIYEEIIENVKQHVQIERVLASQSKSRTSLENIHHLKSVNQHQRIQLKQTLWKIFNQKQQDYQQKISDLNQFVFNFNSEQERLQLKAKYRFQPDELISSQFYIHPTQNTKRPNSLNAKNSTEKKQNSTKTSIQRKPLQEKQTNFSQNIPKLQTFSNCLSSQNQKLISDQNSHARFSFASLLTSDIVAINQNENLIEREIQKSEPEIQKSLQNAPKRKKSRSKFQVVKKMSGSKLEFNSKELGQVSV